MRAMLVLITKVWRHLRVVPQHAACRGIVGQACSMRNNIFLLLQQAATFAGTAIEPMQCAICRVMACPTRCTACSTSTSKVLC